MKDTYSELAFTIALTMIAKEALRALVKFGNFCDRLPPLEHISGMDRLKVLTAAFDGAAGTEESLSLDLDAYYKQFIRPVVFNLMGQIEDIYKGKPLRFSIVPNNEQYEKYISEIESGMVVTIYSVRNIFTASMGICVYP